ncbi:hypothetical protein MXB_2670 [Myxobolus squamalis]|nr:hypothetical protein MXB_2670 [Myxobolus squamalis]
MWNLFKWKSNEPKIEESTAHIKESIQLLNKKSLYLEKQINLHLNKAKSVAAKNRPMALQFLKKKKNFELQLENVDNKILFLEDLQRTTEQTLMIANITSSTKMANQVIGKTLRDTNIDSIENSMMEYQDVKDKLSEIDYFIEQNDDLEKELEEMQQEELSMELSNQTFDLFPSVPTGKVIEPSTDKQDDHVTTLQQLRDWAET